MPKERTKVLLVPVQNVMSVLIQLNNQPNPAQPNLTQLHPTKPSGKQHVPTSPAVTSYSEGLQFVLQALQVCPKLGEDLRI